MVKVVLEHGSWRNDLSLIFLTHDEFRQNTGLWEQVRSLIDQTFARVREPGDRIQNFRRMFLRKKPGKFYALAVDKKGNVVAYTGGVAARNEKGEKSCWLGHTITKPNSRMGWHHMAEIEEHLIRLGFEKIYGTVITREGARAGRLYGNKVLGRTSRGQKHNSDDFHVYKRNIADRGRQRLRRK